MNRYVGIAYKICTDLANELSKDRDGLPAPSKSNALGSEFRNVYCKYAVEWPHLGITTLRMHHSMHCTFGIDSIEAKKWIATSARRRTSLVIHVTAEIIKYKFADDLTRSIQLTVEILRSDS